MHLNGVPAKSSHKDTLKCSISNKQREKCVSILMPICFSFVDDADYASVMCDLVLRWIQLMIRLLMQHIKNIYKRIERKK